ncbi:hypothetical protein ACFQMA_20345 [Halosimplex aquaticum]|uniref:Uncharacterized protein n=1 Tax=Halosimplex aquaticum TaxID=3026162 RepID=A0ABD5Y912_9EURY|nr:hypothetical protein [Halosimplex aquaticum]
MIARNNGCDTDPNRGVGGRLALGPDQLLSGLLNAISGPGRFRQMLFVVALWALFRGRHRLAAAAGAALVVAAASRLAVRAASSLVRWGLRSGGATRRPDACPCDRESPDPGTGTSDSPSSPADAGARRRASDRPLAVFYIEGDSDGVVRPGPESGHGHRTSEPDE